MNLCIKDAFKKQYPPYDVRKHYIKINPDDRDYKCVWADFSKDGEITNIGEVLDLNENDSEICLFFRLETINIPLPFKKGDLIYSKNWDLELMEFKGYKNGHIYVGGIDKANSFFLNNDLDIEFVDKLLCVKIFKEAIRFCDDAVVNFIEKKQILSKEEISNVYKEMR